MSIWFVKELTSIKSKGTMCVMTKGDIKNNLNRAIKKLGKKDKLNESIIEEVIKEQFEELYGLRD